MLKSFRDMLRSPGQEAFDRRDLLAITLGCIFLLSSNHMSNGVLRALSIPEHKTPNLLFDQGRLRLSDSLVAGRAEQPATIPAKFTPFFFQLVPINTAEAELLTSLPGVGEKTAKKIIRFRRENGPFSNITDLQKVPGIGRKRSLQLAEHLTFVP
jgi:competence ComEA-like helix-hairpin-helix protein